MKKKRITPQFFGVVLSLTVGCLLSLLLAPGPLPQEAPPHPYEEEIRDLTLRFHTRPVLRADSFGGNAAQFYRKAAENLLVGEGPEVFGELEGGRRFSGEDLDVWIHVNMNAVDMVRKGTQQFGSALLIEPINGYGAEAPEVARAPVMAGLMIEAALRKSLDGDPEEGARILLDAVRFAQDLARGGGIWHRIYAARAELAGLHWFILRTGRTEISASQWRSQLIEIDRLAWGPHPLARTLETEGALFLADLGRPPGEEVFGRTWRAPAQDRAAILSGAIKTLIESGGAYLDAGGWIDPHEWAQFVTASSESAPAALQVVIADLDLLISVERRLTTIRRVARIGVALMTYKKTRGDFPERLEQLVPNILDAVPGDPLSGGPFLYEVAPGTGATLTSLGPDGDPDSSLMAPVDLSKDPDGDWIFHFGGER
ncbi:MAG: hypothetical protein ACYTFG_07565 [Planctomycetota bacterium]|jgi:hypothetical protein